MARQITYRVIIVFAIETILFGLAYGTAAWASSGPSAGRQGGTVPTRTPKPAPTRQEKDKPTATFVPATQPVGTTPIIVGTATRIPVAFTQAPVVAPALPTGAVTPTVSIVPSVVVITPTVPPPSPIPTRIVVTPTEPVAPSVSDTPVPAAALSAASIPAATAPNYNWLLWVIGLVLIVGGVVLVLMRSREQQG